MKKIIIKRNPNITPESILPLITDPLTGEFSPYRCAAIIGDLVNVIDHLVNELCDVKVSSLYDLDNARKIKN